MELSGHYLISTPAILHDSIVTPEQNPTMLLIKHVTYHYMCLLIESCGSMWWLDSRRNEPVRVSPLYLHTILKKAFSKSTISAAVFILESHDVVHTSQQIQLHTAGSLLSVFQYVASIHIHSQIKENALHIMRMVRQCLWVQPFCYQSNFSNDCTIQERRMLLLK